MAISIIRIGLLPIILLSNIAPGNRQTLILFDSDIVFILSFAMLALTDGFILNLVMMFGPKSSKDQALNASLIVAAQPVTIVLASVLSKFIVSNL